ncbi:hypothetical protein C8R46DRAFT_440920 [Mycena filopes]|nr:hypothetical protein C8R46DRAFT_440920 [Mycena filopes]
MASSHWSRIPPEICHGITEHNATDVRTLRVMSLVSKEMRLLAIERLFSIIHFACAEDFPRWLDMVNTTPSLSTFVRRVKFSQPSKGWLKGHRGSDTSELDDNALPHLLPTLPNVSAVEWVSLDSLNANTVAAYLKLLPNVHRLHLESVTFSTSIALANLLGAFGNLKALSLLQVYVDRDESDEPQDGGLLVPLCTLNLAAINELAITSCGPYDDSESLEDSILFLVEQSPTSGLKSLDLGGFQYNNEDTEPCTLVAMEKLLFIGAPSLVKLAIDPTCFDPSLNDRLVTMVTRLPIFSALQTLTIWLGLNLQATRFLDALTAAPGLTTVIFRIRLYQEDDEEDRKHLARVLDDVLFWTGSMSVKTRLTQKYPSIQRIGFHLSVPHSSDVHFRCGYRRRVEKQLMERLTRAGGAATDYLPVEWLDVENGHARVEYSSVTGKPPWSIPRDHRPWHNREPDTEASDCDSEKSDSESNGDSEKSDSEHNGDSDSDRPRTWTAADEREYQRELRQEAYGSEYEYNEEDSY